MKKLLIILLFPIILNAQVYKAGDVLPYYYDINPDSLISYAWCHQCVITETSSINMFGVAPVDFEIVSYSINGLGGGSENITISPKHSNAFVILGRQDSVFANPWSTPYWWKTNIAKPLISSDTINKVNFIWSNSLLYLIEKDWFGGNYKNVTDFVNTNDKFIGVKYQTSIDTIFGWIRVHCPDRYRCYIKDFSASKSYVGIKELNRPEVSIYPNPVTETLFIKDPENKFQNYEIEITNHIGQTVLSLQYINSVDVSKLVQGIYIIKITSNGNQSYYSKFVKN
ncbi:MAG: T9SS type A sorting domain-containing protein [Sphingobacteriaceae bacterium]|nr:T9SS type A sorting domain-containing protein [Sphingobacteriaceae bacterium]